MAKREDWGMGGEPHCKRHPNKDKRSNWFAPISPGMPTVGTFLPPVVTFQGP